MQKCCLSGSKHLVHYYIYDTFNSSQNNNYLYSFFFFVQVQWNLFSATSLVCDTKDGNKQTARAFTPWVEIEDNYRKYGSQDEFSMKPRFYSLSRTDFNNQDAPKLDGLVRFAIGLVIVKKNIIYGSNFYDSNDIVLLAIF